MRTSEVAAISAALPSLYKDKSTRGKLRRLRRSMSCTIGETTIRTRQMLSHVKESPNHNGVQAGEIDEDTLKAMI